MAEGAVLRVTVAYSPAARVVHEWTVLVPAGNSVRQAVEAAGVLQRFPELAGETVALRVWGHRAGWAQPLREHDRIEFLRDLQVDPKVARRERFRRQGARASGLFARKRAGAKAGY